MLVTRVGVAQTLLARQPAFGQEFERAVNGREAHGRVLDFDDVVEVFGAEMTFGFEKDFEYQLALCRLFESGAPEMFEEDLFFLCEFGHYISRDSRHSVECAFSPIKTTGKSRLFQPSQSSSRSRRRRRATATLRTRAMAKRAPIMIQFIVRSGLSISTCRSDADKIHIV